MAEAKRDARARVLRREFDLYVQKQMVNLSDGGFIEALVVIGLLPQMDGLLAALKLVLVWLLVMLSSAAVSQLIARSVRRREPCE